MTKRPPYLEIIVTVLVVAFLASIIVGWISPRSESFDQVTMRAGR